MGRVLEDLKEATKSDNHYFFGNVLLEKSNNEVSDIIDGQQRVTTIIIFARALCNELQNRAKTETLKSNMSNKEFIQYIQEDYLINRNKPKLEAVEYDRVYFRQLIIENKSDITEPKTPSQKRIKNAKKYFEEELDRTNKDKTKQFSTKELLDMFKVIENAELLEIEFGNKKDSVLMFELQNNRGAVLKNMEKLKSYLSYQIYIYSKNNASLQLNAMTDIFKEIYRKINKLEKYGVDEDSILNYFNISKFGFSYRENDDTKNYKKEFKNIPNNEKIAWINKYIAGLKNAFFDFENFQELDNVYKERLDNLNVWQIYPFIIKAYTLFRGEINKLEKCFEALEIIAFRHTLIRTRGDLPSKLNGVLMGFDSVENLIKGLADICSNEKAYWQDQKVKDSLNQIFITNWEILPYIFERYENHLRNKETITKGHPFRLRDIPNPQREHIAPQTEKDEKVASGYCEYDDDFKQNYLNRIGNLALISAPQNGWNSNRPFVEKLSSYKEQGLLRQLTEIEQFAKSGIWDKDAIEERHKALEKFVLETWSFK